MATEFERLLAEMPRIAQAVNGFQDPEAGHRALDVLLESLGVATASETETETEPPRTLDVTRPHEPQDTTATSYPLGTMATLPVRADTA